VSYYDKKKVGNNSSAVPQKIGGDSMRMSVWDIDSEDSEDMSDDDKKEETVVKEMNIEDMDGKDTEEMSIQR
jgi:hypothetical protein